jgi:hypothetical protein
MVFHTFLFERWIALFRYKSNIGFLMYIADAYGYTGSVGVLFFKNFMDVELRWLTFFINLAYITGICTMIFGLASLYYFYIKEKKQFKEVLLEQH